VKPHKAAGALGTEMQKPDKTPHLNAAKRGLNPGFKSFLEMRVSVLNIDTGVSIKCSLRQQRPAEAVVRV
jgi:hypothetical protein